MITLSAASSPQNDGPAPPHYAAVGPEIIAGRYKVRSIGTREYLGRPSGKDFGLYSDGSEVRLQNHESHLTPTMSTSRLPILARVMVS
jgi:hypothetical protein